MEREPSFMPATLAAVRLGVPANWLKAEAAAGRIPHVCIGRRVLFSPAAVERAIAERGQRERQEAYAHA